MRVVAAATPAFALPTLDALAESADVELAAVITNPDRPRGRGLEPGDPPAKEWALAHGIPCFQPEKLARDVVGKFPGLDLKCDALVVVASAFYVPTWLRNLPRLGAINLHPSLLPALRGPAPIPYAIINGLDATGVTTMLLADEIDAGDILLQEEVPISEEDTGGSLAAKLAVRGARLIVETLTALDRNALTPRPQDPAGATYAPKLTAETQVIDWMKNTAELERLIRALNPEPLAYTTLGKNRVQVVRARPAPSSPGAAFGETVAVDAEGITVACGDGALLLLELKPAGKGIMPASAFARGRHLHKGMRWGSS